MSENGELTFDNIESLLLQEHEDGDPCGRKVNTKQYSHYTIKLPEGPCSDSKDH